MKPGKCMSEPEERILSLSLERNRLKERIAQLEQALRTCKAFPSHTAMCYYIDKALTPAPQGKEGGV